MGKPLKNPPLVEAACEFRFDPSSEWDWTIPGRLFDQIGHEFSERSEFHRLEVRVQQEKGRSEAPPVVETGPDRVQLRRPDGSALVQIGPRLLAVNHLRPYPNWEAFRDLIQRIYRTYIDIAAAKVFSRIGLRYINEIPLKERAAEGIITVGPNLGHSLQRPMAKFYQRYELEHDDPKGILVHQTGSQTVDDEHVLKLDLDFFSTTVGDDGAAEKVKRWLDNAHNVVERAFIDSLVPEFYEHLKRGGE